MLVVVAYDVPEDRRRTKLAEALEAYGRRVQYSVFEALLEPPQIEELLERLASLIDPEEDKVRLYRLCAACLFAARARHPGQ